MHSQDFYRSRLEEVQKFFELCFGPQWRSKVYQRLGFYFNRQPARLIAAEKLARLHGFIPYDEQPRAQALERNFFARLRSITSALTSCPQPITGPTTFKQILDDFFIRRPHRSKHKQKHKLLQSDVISPYFLVVEQPDTRTISPDIQPEVADHPSLEDWLTIPIGEPPGHPGPEGGESGPPISLSGSSEFCI
jgi:hypothetical protein